MKHPRRPFPLLLAALLLANGPAAAETAGDSLRAWVSAVDLTPEWSASFQSLTEDSPSGASVKGLTIRSEQDDTLAVEIGQLAIHSYADAGGGFTAGEVEIDQGRLSAGPVTFTISDVKLSGLAVPNLDDIRLDPRQPFTSTIKAYGAAARMRLDRGSIGRLQLDQQSGGVASAVSYQNVVLGRLDQGRLEQLSAGPVAMVAPAPEGLVRFSIDRVESRGMDIDAMARVFDPDRYPGGAGDGQWRPALAFGAYRNLAIEALDLKISVGTIAVENLQLRQPRRSFAPLFERPNAGAAMTVQESARLTAEHGLDFASSMSVGRIGLEDLDITGTGFSRFRVAAFSVEDLSLDGAGEFRVDDLRIAANGQASFDIDRFAIGRIVLPQIDAIRSVVLTELGGGNGDLSSLLPRVGYVDIRGAKFATPESGEAAIGRFRLDLGSYVGAVPTAIELTTSGISLDRRFLEGFPEARLLDELGYDRLAFNSGLRLDWQESASALRVQDFHVAVDKVGRMSADLDFGDLTRADIQGNGGIGGAFGKMTFGGGTIAVTDDSAIDRVFEAQAARLKIDPETLRKRASDFIPALTAMLANPFLRGQLVGVLPAPLAALVNALTPMLNDPALAKQVVQALQGFIDAKGTITVRARPANPVPLGSLAETVASAPETLPALLSVEVSKTP